MSCDHTGHVFCQLDIRRVHGLDGTLSQIVKIALCIEGLGIALMVETVRLVQPTLVIQLDSSRQTKNLPYVTTEFLESDSGFRWTNDEVFILYPMFSPLY